MKTGNKVGKRGGRDRGKVYETGLKLRSLEAQPRKRPALKNLNDSFKGLFETLKPQTLFIVTA